MKKKITLSCLILGASHLLSTTAYSRDIAIQESSKINTVIEKSLPLAATKREESDLFTASICMHSVIDSWIEQYKKIVESTDIRGGAIEAVESMVKKQTFSQVFIINSRQVFNASVVADVESTIQKDRSRGTFPKHPRDLEISLRDSKEKQFTKSLTRCLSDDFIKKANINFSDEYMYAVVSYNKVEDLGGITISSGLHGTSIGSPSLITSQSETSRIDFLIESIL